MDFASISKLLRSSQTISRSCSRRFGLDRPPGPSAILLCPYSAAIDEFVGYAISSQKDFRIVIGTSNNPQDNIVRVIYIDIPTLRRQSPVNLPSTSDPRALAFVS